MSEVRVLLADDDALSRDFLRDALEASACVVTAVDDGAAALRQLDKHDFDLVVTDLKMPREDGFAVLQKARETRDGHDTPCVLVTAHGTTEVAVRALRLGASDVLVKPVTIEDIELMLGRVEAWQRQRALVERHTTSSDPVIASPAMEAAWKTVARIAKSSATVLVSGESGSGKEIVAAEIHRRSGRSGEYVRINCAAIPPNLIESELFGHERGAFTGAERTRPGCFELADGGTLLLDEVGELPVEVQAKLLRVLEEGSIRRVGAIEARPVDVRIVAATNRDLEFESAGGGFRKDLFYRLSIVPIVVPALRDRPEDVLPLARHFVEVDARDRACVAPKIDDAACELLEEYAWPGNVRELRNLMQRASLLCRNEAGITRELIEPWLNADALRPTLIARPDPALNVRTDAEGAGPGSAGRGVTVDAAIAALVGHRLREVEDRLIQATLDDCNGNRTRASTVLGISPRTLYNRLAANRVQ